MISRILVPLDGSPRAEAVLPHVTALASTFRTGIDLLHVIAPRENGWDEVGSDPLTFRLARADRSAYLEAKARELRSWGIEVRTRVEDGAPAEVIIGLLRGRAYDAIGLTTHGDGDDPHLRLGCTAASVVLNAPSSILLVPVGIRGLIRGGAVPARYHQIIAPVDCSPHSDWSLRVAADLALSSGAALHLVHVLDPPPLVSRIRSSGAVERLIHRILEMNRAEAERYLKEAAWRLGSRGIDVEGEVLEATRAPELVVRDMACDPDQHLVVLSAHGRGGTSDWPLGGTAAKLTFWAAAPVLLLQDLSGAHVFSADEGIAYQRGPQLMRASVSDDRVALPLHPAALQIQ